MQNTTTQPAFLRVRETVQRVRLSRNTIDRLVRSGKFPRPFLIGEKIKAYKVAEIEEWIRERGAARDTYADPACPTVGGAEA